MSFLGHILSRSFSQQTEMKPRTAEPFEHPISIGPPSLHVPFYEENEEPIHLPDKSEKPATRKSRGPALQNTPEHTSSSAPSVKVSGNAPQSERRTNQLVKEATSTSAETNIQPSAVDRNTARTRSRKHSGILRVLAEETLTNPAIASPLTESTSATESEPVQAPTRVKVSRRKKNTELADKTSFEESAASITSQPAVVQPRAQRPPSTTNAREAKDGSLDMPQRSKSPVMEQPPSTHAAPKAINAAEGSNDREQPDSSPAMNQSVGNLDKQGARPILETGQEEASRTIAMAQPTVSAATRSLSRADVLRETTQADEPPVIHVTIGKIEIRASVTAKQNPEQTQRPEPRLTLAEYMKQLHEGRH